MSWMTSAINAFASGMGSAAIDSATVSKTETEAKTDDVAQKSFKSKDPGITIETKIHIPNPPKYPDVQGSGTKEDPWLG